MRKLLYAVKVLRDRGIGFFWTYFIESVWFDLRYGTRTFARVTKDEQTLASSDTEVDNGLLYVASFTSVTQNTLGYARTLLGAARFSEAQFFDLGCGKGKALLVYARAFGAEAQHVATGIEYDPDLAELAHTNLRKCAFAAGKVEVVADSALNVQNYVRSETLIVYLYNSFQGETLRAVLEVLRGTPHVLIYVDPAERALLPDYGYRIHQENQGRYNADTWLVASSGVV